MAKSAEEIGLYDGLPPDATVNGTVEDEANPGWSEVHFSDGRVATLPTEAARELPQTPPDPGFAGTGEGTYGPPVADPGGEYGAPPPPPPGPPPVPEGFTQVPAIDPSGAVPAGPLVQRGDSFRPDGALPTGPDLTKPNVGTGAALGTDPMAAIVSDGSAGGLTPSGVTETSGVTTTERAEDPASAAARTASAYEGAAGANLTLDTMKYRAEEARLAEQQAAYEEQEQETRRAMRQAQLEKEGHARVINAIDRTPIDEDGFWTSAPGRSAGAWVALALSGFLQGATKGQNPALAQMVASLDRDQDRWLDNQRRSREGQYRARERLMGDAAATEASYRMQLAGIISKRIDADAARAGLQPPPGLETYRGALGVKAAEAQTAIGQTITRQATEQVQRESKVTAATGPVRAGDVALRQMGVTPKAHADAMDPKGLNLGGVAGGADRLQKIAQAVDAIRAANNGDFPLNDSFTWSSIGLGAWAARNGIGDGKDEINGRQLLEEAKLAYKQTVNIKSIDSENEGKNFSAILDTGDPESTAEAIRTRADIANQNAISIANGVTQDTQAYLDFVRGRQTANRGARAPGNPADIPFVRDQPAPARGLGPAPKPDGAGSPATGPLPGAAATATSRAAQAPATSMTGSRPGTYQRLRGSRPVAPR